MKYDGELSRFIARAFRLLGTSFEERTTIVNQMPRVGEELPEQVADWVRQARLKISKEDFIAIETIGDDIGVDSAWRQLGSLDSLPATTGGIPEEIDETKRRGLRDVNSLTNGQVIRLAVEVGLKIPASESLVPDNEETRRVRENISRQMLRSPDYAMDIPFDLPDINFDQLNFVEDDTEIKEW